MKIFWIGPYLPAGKGSGGDLRSFHLMRVLKQQGVSLQGFFLDDRGSEARSFFDRVEIRTPRPLLKGVRTLFGGLMGVPFAYGRYYHPEVRTSIPPDHLVYVDHLHMSVNEVFDSDKPVWLDEHNLEYVLWQEYAGDLAQPLRSLLQWESERVKRFELEQIFECTGAAIPSSRQRDRLPESLRDRVHVVPNGVPGCWLQQGRQRLNEPLNRVETLGFIGSLGWRPNRHGLNRFLQTVWPLLHSSHPELRLKIAGRDAPDSWKTMYSGVEVLGYVSSSREFFQSIDALIVPLKIGSGTRLKILEAAARGVPIFSTVKGAEGLELPLGVTPEEIEGLGPVLREALHQHSEIETRRQKCFDVVSSRYRWKNIGEDLLNYLKQLQG